MPIRRFIWFIDVQIILKLQLIKGKNPRIKSFTHKKNSRLKSIKRPVRFGGIFSERTETWNVSGGLKRYFLKTSRFISLETKKFAKLLESFEILLEICEFLQRDQIKQAIFWWLNHTLHTLIQLKTFLLLFRNKRFKFIRLIEMTTSSFKACGSCKCWLFHHFPTLWLMLCSQFQLHWCCDFLIQRLTRSCSF